MKIGIVADDLTGANATGVLLNKQGFTSATVVQTDEIDTSMDMNAICIDTDLKEVGNGSVAIVVGAFPESGRICSGGYLLVNGVPVQETDVASDPLKSIRSSYIPGMIANQSHHFVGYIGLDQVLAKDNA